ncbi:hypothetical protein WA026_009134, partial [Henosepilachna vigintioctopunctata]
GDEGVPENVNIHFVNSIKDIMDGVSMVNGHECVLSNVNRYEDWSNFKEIDLSTLKKYVKKLKIVGGGENGTTKDIFRDIVMVCGKWDFGHSERLFMLRRIY